MNTLPALRVWHILVLILWNTTLVAYAEPPIVLIGARLIDGTGAPPLENAALVIENGRIVSVGKATPAEYDKKEGTTIVDCQGQTIMPSLIANHSHLGLIRDGKFSPDNYTPENIESALKQYQGYGVTAVMSLGVNKDLLYSLRDRQRAGGFGGADIFTADHGVGAPSAAPPIPVGPDQVARPTTPDEARNAVREMAARHPDMIKCWVDDFFGTVPKMKPEIYQAVIDEAHKHGLRAAAHVFYLEDAKGLVSSGVDVLAHSVRDAPVDKELIEAMKARGTAYIATLALDESQFIYAEHPKWMDTAAFRNSVSPDLLGKWLTPEYAQRMRANPQTALNRAAFNQALKNVKPLHSAGILIGFGTDSGATPTRLPGWAEHRELQLLVEAGLTPMEAIVCATNNAANVLGDGKNRGVIEPGKRADFLVLSGNPLDDIRNTTRIVAIYHGGKRLEPAFREPSTEQK